MGPPFLTTLLVIPALSLQLKGSAVQVSRPTSTFSLRSRTSSGLSFPQFKKLQLSKSPGRIATRVRTSPALQAFDASSGRNATFLSAESSLNVQQTPPGPWWRRMLSKWKIDRKRMAELGLSALMSYGFISNINVGIITAVAWATVSQQTGLSPLAEGNWARFIATQVGMYAIFGNLLRPVRFVIATAITPLFEAFLTFLQRRLLMTRGGAIATCIFLFNFLINISFMVSSIWVASMIVGVPAIPPDYPVLEAIKEKFTFAGAS